MNTDQQDWQDFKQQIGLTDGLETVAPNHVEVEVDLPDIFIAESEIAGEGTFAGKVFQPSELIGPAWLGGKRTLLGCKGNHSLKSNAMLVYGRFSIWLVATAKILKGQEITTNYRESKAVRDARI